MGNTCKESSRHTLKIVQIISLNCTCMKNKKDKCDNTDAHLHPIKKWNIAIVACHIHPSQSAEFVLHFRGHHPGFYFTHSLFFIVGHLKCDSLIAIFVWFLKYMDGMMLYNAFLYYLVTFYYF